MDGRRDVTRWRTQAIGGLVAASAVVLASCAASGSESIDGTSETSPPASIDSTEVANSADSTEVDETAPPSTVLITRADVPDDPTNVVVVMTDDQTIEQMRWLPTVSTYMEQGVAYTNSLTNYPLCGPSRATFLTGQHATNHGLDCNAGLAARFRATESNSLGPWLQEAGVHTIHVGKYLNGYGGKPETRYVPDGWDDWRSLAGDAAYKYEQFDMVLNGEFVEYGRNDDSYSTDVLNDHFDEAVRAAPADEPFFAVFTPLAPHYEGGKAFAVPAKRHEDLVTDVLRPDNYDSCRTRDTCPVDGGALNNPELTAEQMDTIDNGYQTASETLFAVDEAFGRMIDTLTELSELDNTVIIFTSDNGFFYGEHGITKGKILPGREALFVPLYIHGPGFGDARTEEAPVSNIDLAPTIVDIFDATPGLEMDGRSLLEFVDPDRALLIQAAKAEPGGGYFGVYANGWLFYDWNGLDRNELYAADDVLQLTSLDDDPEWDPFETSLSTLTEQLKACAGPSCAVRWRNPGDETPVEVAPPTTVVETDAVTPSDETPDDEASDPPNGTVVVEGDGPTVTVRALPRALELSWVPIDGAEAYRYRVAEDDGEPGEWIRTELDTDIVLTELDSDIEYSIEITTRRDAKWRKGTVVVARPLVDPAAASTPPTTQA